MNEIATEPQPRCARSFAVARHGQQRYGNHPYVVHLDAVATALEPYGPLAQVVGYLHDDCEDTDTTVEDVNEHFGPLVSACVTLLTDEPGADRAARKERMHRKLATVTGKCELALIVKAADRLSNVRAWPAEKQSCWRFTATSIPHSALRPTGRACANLCGASWMRCLTQLKSPCANAIQQTRFQMKHAALASVLPLILVGCASSTAPRPEDKSSGDVPTNIVQANGVPLPVERRAVCKKPILTRSPSYDASKENRFKDDFNNGLDQEPRFKRIDSPPQVLSNSPPSYPVWAKYCGVEGSVAMRVRTSAEGRVIRVDRIGNPHPILAHAAISAVTNWRFRPSSMNGAPVDVAFIMPINFVLDNTSPQPRVTSGRKDVAPDAALVSRNNTIYGAQIEAKLGAGIRFITPTATEAAALKYARAVVEQIDAAGKGVTFNASNRVILILNSQGRPTAIVNVDATTDTQRRQNALALRGIEGAGPVPVLPGADIDRIAFFLPFELPLAATAVLEQAVLP